jgi:outer membrane receptor protein involved in Fe transport
MSKFLRFCFASLLLLAVCALSAMAQSTVTGAISGTVRNPNKEVVTGATVTVKNNGTNQEATATTDENGFKVNNLNPGTYTVTVNATGFAPFTNAAVIVEVGRATALDVGLGLQGVSGTVEVTGEAPVINTTQQDFSSNVNQTSVNELPVNGRRWSSFVIMTPGTVPDGTFGLISFRGISGLLNNNTVDGGDNNQAFFAEERGRTRSPYSVSQASIREFQVNTSNFSAEYGRSAGGVTNAVTKSGTNDFHGTGFLYDRNNKWGARNPRSFVNQLVNGVSTPVAIKAVDVRYQFGGAVGGPIVKNKAFFFFSYDQQKRNFPGISVFVVPSYLSGVNTCVSAVAPGCTTALFATSLKNPNRNLTDAQITAGLNFINSETGETPRRGDQKLFLPKIDWHINQNHTFTASYNRLRWNSPAGVQTAATVTRGRQGYGDDFVTADSVNLRLSSTLSSNLINEFRFQWANELDTQFAQSPLAGEPTTAGGFSPQITLTNGITIGKSNSQDRRALPDETRLQFADTMTVTRGSHTIKFGADINHVKDILDQLFTEAGAYTYGNINDFIVDYTNFTSAGALRTAGAVCSTGTRVAGLCYTSNYQQGFGPPRFPMTTVDYAFFGQDDWRVNPRLTLNLGLRWDYQQFPQLFPNLINPTLLINGDQVTAHRPSDKKEFGPRIGFALDVNGDGKTSLRGGYGIYYGRSVNSTIIQSLINTGLTTGQIVSSVAATAAGAPIFPNILAAAPSGTASVQYFANGFRNPKIHQGDLVIEREVARNTVVSASYLFSFGKFLPNFVDVNLTPPTVGRTINIVDGPFAGQQWNFAYFLGAARPIAGFGSIQEIRSNVDTKYHALVLQANRRFTKGLQFQVNYTLSRAWDTGQTSQTFTPGFPITFNPFDQAAEGGLSSFDRRHKFVASVVYNTQYKNKDNKVAHALLNGWTIAPIVSMFSGARYTGQTSGSSVSSVFGFSQAGGVNGANSSLRFAYVPNNFFKQPPIKYVDLRVSRRFPIGEKAKLEVLAEGFNIFNRTEVTSVNTTIYNIAASGGQVNATFNPAFGSTTGADGFFFRERQVQLAVRFEF